jgi:N-acetylglucosamine kinase-like BadF-type ATPase
VGGTKTHALVADGAGRVRGVGRAGPGNWEGAGLDGAHRALAGALEEALAEAGAGVADLAGGGYGLAGLDFPSDEERLRPVVQRLGVPGPQVLVNDAYVALRAGSLDGCGVGIVAGTGTTIAGRNRKGERFRTFGFSARWGDFGASADVVLLATRAVSHAYLGRGKDTALSGRFLAHYGARDVPEMIESVVRGGAREPDGTLAPIVFDVAARGDGVAREVLRCVGREMGENAVAVARRLELLDEPFDLVMAGGVFRSESEHLLGPLVEIVRASAPLVQPVPLRTAPVVGGVLLAMDAAGDEVSPDAWRRLSAEAAQKLEVS